MIVYDRGRVGDIAAEILAEPRLRPHGDTDSMQSVRRDHALIERRHT
jgi:hypothetical protein